MIKNILGILCLIFILSCGSKKNATKNLFYVYNPSELKLSPEFKLVNISDSTSRLYYKFNTSNITFVHNKDSNWTEGNYSINLDVYNSTLKSKIATEYEKIYLDTLNFSKKIEILDSIDIKTDTNTSLIVEAKLKDINAGTSFSQFITHEKYNSSIKDYILVKDENGNINFKEYVLNDNLDFLINKQTDSLRVRKYKYKVSPAFPPHFLLFPPTKETEVDTIFTTKNLDFINNENSGIFEIQSDTSISGNIINKFDESIFNLNSPEQLIEPLKYLSTDKEFKALKSNPDKKQVIDDYWINIASDHNRARKLIKEYYGRVEYANKEFSSYYEGWKTDRGMIYIIFGEPTMIRKGLNYEIWIYGQLGGVGAFDFRFYKEDIKFSNNEYSLDRSAVYKTLWFDAVENWRNGIVKRY